MIALYKSLGNETNYQNQERFFMSTEDTLLKKYNRSMMDTFEISQELNMHPTQTRRFMAEGKIPAIRIGGRWYCSIHKLAALMDGENLND